MVGIQPELWFERPAEAIAFYRQAFGASLVHSVGDGDDIVAQLAIGDAMFWVATASPEAGRFDPRSIRGATSRFLLLVEDPDAVARQALAAGAIEKSPPANEHGWRVGRVNDPFGYEWEIARPLGDWPPASDGRTEP